MGSFTSLASKTLMRALFPTCASNGVSTHVHLGNATSDSTGSNFRIYNQTLASTYGIYAGSSLATVAHRIDLILGTNSSGGAATNAILDGGITVNGLAQSGSPTAGTISFPVAGSGYINYQGMTFTSATTNNHMWKGWTLSGTQEGTTTIGAWRVDSNGQIGFPTNSGTTVYAWGFTISACGTKAGLSPAVDGTGLLGHTENATTLMTTAPSGGMPVIFAYGDLSSGRAINNGDTPVFTDTAIKITLD